MAKRKKSQRSIHMPAPTVSGSIHADENAVNGNGFSGSNGSIDVNTTIEEETSFEDAVWVYGRWAVLAVAAALRFVELTLKPFHHDEGVNGFFLTNLFRDGIYKYDPSNYHGPSLYYFGLLSAWIFGLDDLAVRIVVAVFGLLTVALVFSLRRYLGTIGTLAAAAFVAVSPGLTFFSRYFIHEILLVFFTFAAAVCILKFTDGDRVHRTASAAMALTIFVCLLPAGLQAAAAASAGDRVALYVARFVAVIACGVIAGFVTRCLHSWDAGRPVYLLLAAASASLTFTTKETSFISLGTMLIAAACVAAWLKVTASADSGAANKRIGFLVAAAGILAGCIYFASDTPSGINWLMDNYLLGPDKQEQTLVFLCIGVLLIVAAETGRRYLVYVWKRPGAGETWIEPAISFKRFTSRVGESGNAPALIFGSVIVFAAVAIVFFTSFLTNEKGLNDAFEAYNVWTKTGSSDHAQNGTWAYLKWTIGAESPILILAALGTIIALWTRRHRFAMFAGLWAFGLFAAYTLIPYKTPWIAINFVLPMALAAGYAINELASGDKWWEQLAAKVLAVLGLSICLIQCVELNFFRYDDERRPYVYVHSKRSMNEMIEKIGEVSQKANIGDKASIVVTSPENWPLPWSLNQYKGTVVYGSVVKSPNAEFVIGSKAQRADLDRDYSATHAVIGTYGLRPGVDLLLYVRKDLIANHN
jgi:predicted membrane-bound mannosyltransferase